MEIFEYYHEHRIYWFILYRLKKASTSSPVASTTDENVYNPSRDLFSKTSTPTAATAPKNPDGIQDVYSPTQDVQDLYRPPPGLLQRPPSMQQGSSGYNPRNDLLNTNQPGMWDTNYDTNQRNNYYQEAGGGQGQPSTAAAPVRGDPRANRRDPRRRD